MLALALFTLELETCCPDWLPLTIELLRKAQVCSVLTSHISLIVAFQGVSQTNVVMKSEGSEGK